MTLKKPVMRGRIKSYVIYFDIHKFILFIVLEQFVLDRMNIFIVKVEIFMYR